jgi:hypothetical protein
MVHPKKSGKGYLDHLRSVGESLWSGDRIVGDLNSISTVVEE